MVPTRTQSSAGTSPPQRHRCSPPGQVTLASTTAPSIGRRRSLTTWTSSASASPGATTSGGRSHTTITGRQASASAVAGLGHPVVAQNRPRDRRVGIGEGELAEATGRAVLQPAQRLDVMLEHVAWYAWVATFHPS